MAKLLLVVLIALTFEAIGVVMLSKGLKEVVMPDQVTFNSVLSFVRSAAINPRLLGGVFFEALFFGGLLILMSKGDVSFVWPLTSLGFVFTAVAAKFYLREEVDATRWAGVVLIMLGVCLISWSERSKQLRQAAAASASVTSPAVSPTLAK